MIHRAWAMPSAATFTIPPIRDLLARYVLPGQLWADPFAGWNSPAAVTNDLNPDAPTTHHEDAVAFSEALPDGLDGVLFDPPYSPRQISEAYKGIGLAVGTEETQNGRLYKAVRDAFSAKVRPGGVVISCGWNSAGMGKERLYRMEEVLLVAHGGAHNDTIVVVERKLAQQGTLS